ncbi:amidohydrolase [Halococcus salifodinae]|uniref:Amidohydrolase n=1 Tax=Halococcus salifodinae DSM 8989 TaxID=1227456 RepID=M0N6E8_9EURY|nr:amidohydrolase [Halococcus salifodinae]EMA53441.1 amidohydrolase [Halococcus salifodinae DSM 8989]
MTAAISSRLTDIRRRLHRFPEPAWREFRTTATLVEELRTIGVDELAVGSDAYDPDDRMAVPSESELAPWYSRAREAGVDEELLTRMDGGNTGVVAVLEQGAGPSIGLRVDIDGLFIEESTESGHHPQAEGFRSETGETMHSCGHDGHMTIGLGVLEAIKESDFSGTLTVFFQPAEEESGGGNPMAQSRFADGLDYLFAVHLGLDHPSGEVVAGIEKPLAMCHLTAEFIGTSAHAGKEPQQGDNAIQAMATAIQNIYGIPRHRDGMTRVNVGRADAGSASNVIAERAKIWGEVRGETTPLREYMKTEFERTLYAAAETHDCDVDFNIVSESPRADSDEELADIVYEVADGIESVDSPVRRAAFGASEDATFLMERVQEEGGLATYLIVGTDHPTSHHTPTFDIDERSLETGIDVLTDSILATADERV